MTDRDANGKFVKGNNASKGRPPREREQRYYEILMSAVSFEDWERIVKKARDQALKGSIPARKWLADYLVGVPPQRHELTGENGGEVIIKVVYDNKP